MARPQSSTCAQRCRRASSDQAQSRNRTHSVRVGPYCLASPAAARSVPGVLLIEMAGASGLLAGSAFFIGLEIVFWFGIQFFGGRGGKG